MNKTTNPGLPTLADVPVMEPECRRRTGEIMAIQRETLSAVHTLGSDVAELRTSHKQHVAWHRGGEDVRQGGQKTGTYYIGVAGLAVTLAALLVTVVWLVAHI